MRLLVQQRHVQVAARPPLALGDVLEPGGHQHERAPPVGEGASHPRAAPDLAVDAFDGVVGADAAPVLLRESRVRERLRAALEL